MHPQGPRTSSVLTKRRNASLPPASFHVHVHHLAVRLFLHHLAAAPPKPTPLEMKKRSRDTSSLSAIVDIHACGKCGVTVIRAMEGTQHLTGIQLTYPRRPAAGASPAAAAAEAAVGLLSARDSAHQDTSSIPKQHPASPRPSHRTLLSPRLTWSSRLMPLTTSVPATSTPALPTGCMTMPCVPSGR